MVQAAAPMAVAPATMVAEQALHQAPMETPLVELVPVALAQPLMEPVAALAVEPMAPDLARPAAAVVPWAAVLAAEAALWVVAPVVVLDIKDSN